MKKRIRNNMNLQFILRDQSGASAVIIAIMAVVILSLTAFAIDIARVLVVGSELQNAADATALAAANHIFPRVVFVDEPPEPDWTGAAAYAADVIMLNKADGKALSSCLTECGYWDIEAHQPSNYWHPCTEMPTPPTPLPANWAPGIRVIVNKNAETNNGPVQHGFAPVLGIKTQNVTRQATAVLASPGRIRPGAFPPVAISKEAATNPDLIGGETFKIGSPYMFPNSLAGQWTSFELDANDVTTVRNLIVSGNGTAVTLNDTMIWIQPGVKTTLYDNPNHPSINRDYAGKDVYLPVIDAIISDSTHEAAVVVGYIGFHIDYATGGSEKTITGHFTTAFYDGSDTPGPGWGPLDMAGLTE